MVNYSKLFQKIWRFFRRSSTSDLEGYRQSIFYPGSTLRANYDLPEVPIRPTYGDLNLSYELLEAYHWSYEYRHAIDTVASDCFQQLQGQIGSWFVEDELSDGTRVAPEVLEVAEELSGARYGKDLILGGDALMRAAIECLAFGDSFVELGLEKTGLSKDDWDITSAQYLPVFSMFVEKDAQSRTLSYIQRTRLSPSEDDVYFNPVKILHFKYKSRGLYGNPIGFPSLEAWRKFKECSVALETAARDVAIVPWLHILPEDKTEKDRIEYMQRHEAMAASGIITNLYLMNGAEVKKATIAAGDTLKPLMDYWLQLRYMCIPPRIPAWLFPGMLDANGGAKDLNGQPALTYSRLISEVRSLLGEQVRWAINLKLVLRYGYDFYHENRKFDICWPEWILTPLTDYAQELRVTDDSSDSEDDTEDDIDDDDDDMEEDDDIEEQEEDVEELNKAKRKSKRISKNIPRRKNGRKI